MRMTQLCRIFPALALAVALTGAAHAEGVRILGRSMPNPGGGFTIQWPSSGFEASFSGTQLTATIDDWGSNWLNVEIDGVVSKLGLRPGINTYTLFSGVAGQHTVRVTRRTGAQVGPTRILGVRARSGEINPTATPERRILVIGDSIASGYGVECMERTIRYTHDSQNADLAYPSLLAKTFGADLQSVSVDGRGLIRNFSGDDETMELTAWRTLPDTAAAWPASKWQPDAIIVNLGTNDFVGGDPGEKFDAAYVGLLRRLRAVYPNAEIIAAFGAMLDGANYAAAKTSITEAAKTAQSDDDPRISVLEFKPTNSPQRYGCDWHPGIDAHREIADQIQTVLTKRLGWTGKAQAAQSLQLSVAGPTGLRR